MQLKTVTIHFTITGERWGTPIRCKLFLCIYANTHLFVFLARLCIANNIPDDNISQVDSQRVLHSTTSAAPEASPEALMYSTPTGFYAGQSPSPKLIPVKPPPGQFNRPPCPVRWWWFRTSRCLCRLCLYSTLVKSQNNAYGTIPPMYTTIAHTSPPIHNIASSYGVSNDVFTDLHCM
jgi:hypothetical protein